MSLDAPAISGFSTWMNFVKACIALSAVLGTVVWSTITWGLDERYADKSVEEKVASISVSLSEIRKQQIRSAVPLAAATACGAAGVASVAYAQQVEDLKAEYQKLTGGELFVPSCAEIYTP